MVKIKIPIIYYNRQERNGENIECRYIKVDDLNSIKQLLIIMKKRIEERKKCNVRIGGKLN